MIKFLGVRPLCEIVWLAGLTCTGKLTKNRDEYEHFCIRYHGRMHIGRTPCKTRVVEAVQIEFRKAVTVKDR